jgi:hypothetical protein
MYDERFDELTAILTNDTQLAAMAPAEWATLAREYHQLKQKDGLKMKRENHKELSPATRAEQRENYEDARMRLKLANIMLGQSSAVASVDPAELAGANIDKEHNRLWKRAKLLLEKAEDNETSNKERARIQAELKPIIQNMAKYAKAKKELNY